MMRVLTGQFIQSSADSHPAFYPLSGEIKEGVDLVDKEPPMEHRIIATFVGDKLHSWKHDPAVLPENTKHRDVLFTRTYREARYAESENRQASHADAAKKFQDMLNRSFQGYKTWKIYPNVIHASVGGLHDSKTFRKARKAGEEKFEREFDWEYIHGGSSSRACGYAGVGGSRGITFAKCGDSTHWHEAGHMIGFRHDFGEDGEYDGSSIMGNGKFRYWYHPMHLEWANAIHPDHVDEIEAGESREVWLQDSDTLELAMMLGCDRLVIARQPRGSSAKLLAAHVKGEHVYIWKPLHSTGWAKSEQLARLDKNQNVYEGFGRRIELVDNSDGYTVLNIENGGDEIIHKPYDRPIYPTPTQAHPFDGQSGLWANMKDGVQQWSSQGVLIRHIPKQNKVRATWLTWEETNSRMIYGPQAYWSTMNIDASNVAEGTLKKINRFGRVIDVGSAMLYFQSETDGMFYAMPTDDSSTQQFASPLENLTRSVEDNRSGTHDTSKHERLQSFAEIDFMITASGQKRVVGFSVDKNGWKEINGKADETWDLVQHEGGVRGARADTSSKVVGTATIENQTLNYTT